MLTRVVHVMPTAEIGGVQSHVRDLAFGLQRRGVVLSVVVGTEGVTAERLRAGGVDVRIIPMHRRSDYAAVRSLAWHFREWKADLVHLHSPLGGILGRHAALWAHRPSVFTMHGMGVLDEFQRAGSVWHRVKLHTYIWHERWLNHRTDAIVCLTPRLAAKAIDLGHVPAPRVVVIPSGIAVPERVARNGSRPIVAYIGRLHREKGIDDLVPMLTRIRSAISDVILRVVGDGPDRMRLRRSIEEAGMQEAVEWLGATDDVDRALTGVRCVVLPSHAEGLPYVALEAMARAVPCVATAVGGLPDLIAHEQTGLLVPPENPAALAEAVVRMLSDLEAAARMSGAARQAIAARFAREAMIDLTLDLYERVLARCRR